MPVREYSKGHSRSVSGGFRLSVLVLLCRFGLFAPFLREAGAKQKTWEKKFYRGK